MPSLAPGVLLALWYGAVRRGLSLGVGEGPRGVHFLHSGTAAQAVPNNDNGGKLVNVNGKLGIRTGNFTFLMGLVKCWLCIRILPLRLLLVMLLLLLIRLLLVLLFHR